MQKEKFEQYLMALGKGQSTASKCVANCQNVENNYSDLDEIFFKNEYENLIDEFKYSKEDEKANKKVLHRVKINGNQRTGTATLKTSLNHYFDFLLNNSIMDVDQTVNYNFPTFFKLESDLENALCNQVEVLFPDYIIFNYKGKPAKQFIIADETPVRKIDLILENKSDKHLLVIEIKGKEISRETFGQLSEYLVLIQEIFPEKIIKGCLIGNDFADNMEKIISTSKFEIFLKRYEMTLKLENF